MTARTNPRYLAYCASQGRTAEQQIEFDEDRYPGGRMTGFSLWIQYRWSCFRSEYGCKSQEELWLLLGVNCSRLFDEWLGAGPAQGPEVETK